MGGELGPVVVRAGEATAVELLDAVRLVVRAWWRRDGAAQLQLELTSLRSGGVTLYRGGRRVPATWTLLDAAGAAAGQGAMEYG